MNEKEALDIYGQGPSFDVGVDAQYYIAKGYIEDMEKSNLLVEELQNVFDSCDGCARGAYKLIREWKKGELK